MSAKNSNPSGDKNALEEQAMNINIADYSKFVFERHRLAFQTPQIISLSTTLWGVRSYLSHP
ncbi:MAG: hypothetical protein ACFCU8_19975 [Thermosynechococcaceae cyanobacterium]